MTQREDELQLADDLHKQIVRSFVESSFLAKLEEEIGGEPTDEGRVLYLRAAKDRIDRISARLVRRFAWKEELAKSTWVVTTQFTAAGAIFGVMVKLAFSADPATAAVLGYSFIVCLSTAIIHALASKLK